MRVEFLGTGTSQGVPVIACDCEVCRSTDPRDNRLRSSILLNWDDKHVIIDTGPDFRYQMLRSQTKKLDAILFTHAHKDHIAGLDDVRAFNQAQEQAIPIFADQEVQTALKREFFYAFQPEIYFGVPKLSLFEIDEKTDFQVFDQQVTPIEVMHYKLPVLGFRWGDFTYITDAKTISANSLEKIYGTQTLVLNALQITPHISHFTLDEALAMAERIGAENTYFTHISHKMGLHEAIEQSLPPGIQLAYDGLVLSV